MEGRNKTLKPCSICGYEAVAWEHRDGAGWRFYCPKCRKQDTGFLSSYFLAIEEWGRCSLLNEPVFDTGIKDDKVSNGIKYDSEKLRWTLLPWKQLEEVVKVLQHGADKYSDDNWQQVKPVSRYYDALTRHLVACHQGELIDPETGLKHMAQVACNALFIMWHEKQIDREWDEAKAEAEHSLSIEALRANPPKDKGPRRFA